MITAVASSDPIRPTIADRVRHLAADYTAWAARCYTILTKTGAYCRLRLNAIQQAIGAAEEAAQRDTGQARIYVLKARQGGVSTDQQARSLHRAVHQRGFTGLTLADNDKNRDKLFLITQRALERYPLELLPTTGAREIREVGFPGRDSRFWTDTAGSKTAGRAITLWRLHLSEFAHFDDARAVLSAAAPALVPRGSVVVLETTGGGYDSYAHEYWRRAQKGETGYRALFFPWWECDPVHYRIPLLAPDEIGALSAEEQDLVKRCGLTLEQIKWRRAKIAEMNLPEFLQEFAEDEEACWLTTGQRYFDIGALKALGSRIRMPVHVEMDGALEVYAEEWGKEKVVLGVDTAEGVAGDRSTWAARAFPSWRLLSTFASSRVAPEEFADLLNLWGCRYGKALLVVEKNMHGITVLRRLRDHHRYPESALYHRTSLDRAQRKATEHLGWATTGETVPLMLAAGREILAAALTGTAGVPSAATLRDFAAVKRADDGRVKLTGRDLAVAEMLAWLGRSAIGFERIHQPWFPGMKTAQAVAT